MNASVVIGQDGSFVAHTNTSYFLGRTGSSFDKLNLIGFYSNNSKGDSFGQAKLLHFGKVSWPVKGQTELELRHTDSSYVRQVVFDNSNVNGLIISVEKVRYYIALDYDG
jgi:hypothetical protein